MMITAIQPTIALHYCGDELSSLHILNINEFHDPCCDDDTESGYFLSASNFCCETEMLKLATDEYQPETEKPLLRVSPISIDITGITPINQLVTSEPKFNTLLTSLKFPTKGFYLADVSILTYICIYLI